ncbi:MAG: hypothetical protein ACE5HL_09575 [Terriglobia bacterium]
MVRRLAVAVYFLLVLLTAVGFGWGAVALGTTSYGELSTIEWIDVGGYCIAVILSISLAVCTLRFKSTTFATIATLSLAWYVVWVWYYWFSYRAPGRLYEGFVGPSSIRQTDSTQMLLTIAVFVAYSLLFAILPIMKYRSREE